MVSITPIYEEDGDSQFREFFQPEFVSQHLGYSRIWQGEGAKILGLKNPVSLTDFRNLLNPRSLDGAKQFPNLNGNGNHELGWRLKIAAHPSLSVLWALAPRADRARIQHTHFCAARHALFDFQEAVNKGRGSAWTTTVRDTHVPCAVFATFSSGAAWDQSPQLQTNAFFFNVAPQPDGSVRRFANDHVQNQKSHLQQAYNDMLDCMLWGDIGSFRMGPGPELEIADVPRKLVSRFTFESPFAQVNKPNSGQTAKRFQSQELFEAWRGQALKWGYDPKAAEEFIWASQIKRQFHDFAERLRTDLQRGRNFFHRSRESLQKILKAKQPQSDQTSSRTRTKETKNNSHSHSH